MKRIFLGIFIVFASMGLASAQATRIRTTLSKSVDTAGRHVATISYDGLENSRLKVFVATIDTPQSSCFGNYNISNLRVADPTTASLTFDPVNNVYKVRWTSSTDTADACQVLFVKEKDQTVDASNLRVWRSAYGNAGLAREDSAGAGSSAGSVRRIYYYHSVDQ